MARLGLSFDFDIDQNGGSVHRDVDDSLSAEMLDDRDATGEVAGAVFREGYERSVLPATDGCDFDFLQPPRLLTLR